MKSNTINMKIKPTTLIRVDNNDNHYEQHQVQIQGRSGRNPLKIVKAKRIVSGFKKSLPIYILKINKPEKVEEGQDPIWLKEYQDVFLEELTYLPPKKDLVHEIELILGAQPIVCTPYKMSPSKVLEL